MNRRLRIALFIALLLPPLATIAAPPRIDNRPARPDEWGYRPADGATARLNPPSFTWIHENGAVSYTVQWSRDEDWKNAETVSDVPWPTYTHQAPLPSGTYYWRYQFQTQDGRKSNWSRTRSVVVPASAIAFPMPTRAQQRERVPAHHPRLFLRPEDLPRLRELAQGRDAKRFRELRASADRILQAGPTPEPEHLGSARDKHNLELIKYWWPNRVQTLKACQEAETLAFVYLITQEKRYGEAARKWMLHLMAWDPDGPTNYRLNCEAGKPMIHRPARVYDWAWDMFTPADRELIHRVMSRRIQDAWVSGEVRRGVGHLNRPYGSHANRVWHKLAESGIVFLGELPAAETWLDYAVNNFYACYPVWSGPDGGWHEGVSYWSGYLSKAVWWMQFAQEALGIDGLKKPFFAHVGDYPLYIAPPHSPNSGFGDLSYHPPSRSIGAFMEYFIRAKGAQPDGEHARYWRWWTEQWHMAQPTGILGFLYAANLPPLPPAKAPADLPQSKIFHGIGVASLHTTLLDSRDDVHFLFKSSPFGTQSHGHNPHNTFQLNAYGEALLTTCVYRDLHGSPFHYQWAHSTRAHNGVLVNGQGQIKHTAAPHGRIVHSELTPRFDYVVGDATDAYGGRLRRYRRHVAFVKSPTPFIVLYDELEAREPSTFQFMLHALKPFQVRADTAELNVALPRAGLTARYLSPVPLAFRQWDGYDPQPRKKFPNQWHVEAGTKKKQNRLDMITVLAPYRAGKQSDWQATRADTERTVQVRLACPGLAATITFRKHDAPPAAPVVRFDN